MRVKLNAFHKDSSAVYSKTVEANSKEDLMREIAVFHDEQPFTRWYDEHEPAGDANWDAHQLDNWLKEINAESDGQDLTSEKQVLS